jgi:hypothetical protein
MKRKLFLALLALTVLIPWPVAYAYDNNQGEPDSIVIETAAATAQPGWKAFGHAIGGVTPGDLFYIDTGNLTPDIPVTLYITNTDELVHYYRYLTLNIGIYVEAEPDRWEKATMGNGELFPDTYITMFNGSVRFTLPGYARYKIAVDRGCFYCYGARDGDSAVAPAFYITAG